MKRRRQNEKMIKKKQIPVKDPVLDAAVRIRGLVCSLMPVRGDLAEETILVLLGASLDLLALGGNVRVQLVRVPAVVGSGNLVFPVTLD